MNTRKDFERAAVIVRNVASHNLKEAGVLLAGFVLFFREDNPQFDAVRFVKAAGMAGTGVSGITPPKGAGVKPIRRLRSV